MITRNGILFWKMKHRQRAVDYYQEYCISHELKFEQQCYDLMYYHDRDGQIGIEAIAGRNQSEKNRNLYDSKPRQDKSAVIQWICSIKTLEICRFFRLYCPGNARIDNG